MRKAKRRGPAPTWKVLNPGNVPDPAPNIACLKCLKCGAEAALPVLGVAIAQIGQGLVFDLGPYAMPKVIQCRRCREIYEGGSDVR